MTSKHLHLPVTATPSARARDFTAGVLRSAGFALTVLARRLGRRRHPAVRHDPVLEFYAEAGAPEGALFVDGQLVGRLPGVTRL